MQPASRVADVRQPAPPRVGENTREILDWLGYTDACFPEVAMIVHKRNQRHRRFQDYRREPRQAIEGGFGRRVEQGRGADSGESRAIGDGPLACAPRRGRSPFHDHPGRALQTFTEVNPPLRLATESVDTRLSYMRCPRHVHSYGHAKLGNHEWIVKDTVNARGYAGVRKRSVAGSAGGRPPNGPFGFSPNVPKVTYRRSNRLVI